MHPLLFFAFLLCFIGIVITAYWSIESIKALAVKYKLSDTFVGALFLSVGTSFPEFINSIASGFHDKGQTNPTYALYSFYNVTGANIWQVVFLSVAIAVITINCAVKKKQQDLDQISTIFWEDSIFSWELIFWETILLIGIFFVPPLFESFNFKGFNLINLVFLWVWIWYLKKTYQHDSKNSNRRLEFNFFNDWNKYSLLAITLFLWIVFGSLAYANFYITSMLPLPKSAAFGIILSFITSTPEFSALYFLFRKREYLIAVGGFFGSSLFNLTLPTYTNWISSNSLMGKRHLNQDLSNNKIGFWLLLNLLLLVLFLFSFQKKEKWRNTIQIANGCSMITLYISLNILLNSLSI
ncbi:sodium:calcium antiporter [Candidatus Mycoplasma haematobovis]|uniref:Sodium:calcium antiporter n=1 Tax=Candidatus Mycoplasma haematobovis TaxID=432608 RepID=A0A1A9QFL2_9MOLU|nr:sodium:calcium antiporter [Candidatus Mycoplasma haematobovis]OAL10736.1 sodium:calcium antiporter [Candidatus Mycoplasma haematobovis]